MSAKSREGVVSVEEILADAGCEGYEAGVAAGSWLLDGNSSEADARRLLDGIEGGDPVVMDELPSAPLSGEYADGLLPQDVWGWYGMTGDEDHADDVLYAFEDGYARGVDDEACRMARAILGES